MGRHERALPRLQFRHWLRSRGPVAAVRRVALNYPRIFRWRARFCRCGLSPLLLVTYTEARSWSHLHFFRGSRERAHAPFSVSQDVRSKSNHESALRGGAVWYDAVSGLDVRGPPRVDAPFRRLPRGDSCRDLHEPGAENDHAGHQTSRPVARTRSARYREGILETRS